MCEVHSSTNKLDPIALQWYLLFNETETVILNLGDLDKALYTSWI